ncbi:Lrp/AsnC family transcriptional regulator [Glutamicibacter bergerei]|uniref:Lrp/AsnC family transcriptional regulator n=2 Tax=Glutamicibacter TaxID=1742989 RepID=A0ABV9MI19_9MICC|nr:MULTISPECIES: Lrp/AsnC family transcriptional regulator [Glutamicibacter]PCC35241.1 transcriptional regulator [Glutamicibacter sp. BW77]GGJ46531.1 putative transcriptional regulator, AsnC family protein [Glutamicibacter ardleyensis]HBV09383.1 Lrp/AsnC family transcriptional regulator [Micrococcaceae bacterium]
MVRLDDVDLKILLALIRDPRIQISELADEVAVARNTAQSRLRRLQRAEVLRAGGRDVDLSKLGYDVLAFVTLEVLHRELDTVVTSLRQIPNVLEIHETSGRGDVWVRLIATDTHQLQSGLRQILRIKGVTRSETTFALHTHLAYRTSPLLEHYAEHNH